MSSSFDNWIGEVGVAPDRPSGVDKGLKSSAELLAKEKQLKAGEVKAFVDKKDGFVIIDGRRVIPFGPGSSVWDKNGAINMYNGSLAAALENVPPLVQVIGNDIKLTEKGIEYYRTRLISTLEKTVAEREKGLIEAVTQGAKDGTPETKIDPKEKIVSALGAFIEPLRAAGFELKVRRTDKNRSRKAHLLQITNITRGQKSISNLDHEFAVDVYNDKEFAKDIAAVKKYLTSKLGL